MPDQLIQAPPKGLLYLLGQKTGINPNLLPDHVQPTLDLFPFYGQNYLRTTSVGGAGIAPGSGLQTGPVTGFAFWIKMMALRFTVPAGMTSLSWVASHKASISSPQAMFNGGEVGPPTVLTAGTIFARQCAIFDPPLSVLPGGNVRMDLTDLQGAANIVVQIHLTYYELRN